MDILESVREAGDARTRYHRAMAGFFKALRAGLNGEPDVAEGDRFTAAGKVITCSHCAHDRFAEGHAQLNTAGMSFLNLDWANRSAATLACLRCGHIEWFLHDPDSAE